MRPCITMQPLAINVAWSVCVCLLVTTVSPAKTAEPIEMPFGLWTAWCVAQKTMY